MIEIHSCRITYVFLKKLFVACFFGMSFSIPVFTEDYGMHNYESSQQKQAQTKKSIMVKGKVVDEQGEPLHLRLLLLHPSCMRGICSC